ncbi:CGNR zinc finger domain-containing protein [Streptomyces aculeolatus]|uniref:CGNR zinc finger domain-containing protein n=1 Tax=Streptomyces aculeolatus TaxID=270689 RepID=UPI001CEC7779|nr:CGNR zinc finger domain-containing protein [Streptomyces aculeolatus]
MTRPLTGEPLALDLVNTWWIDQGSPVDFFYEPDGVGRWLGEHGLSGHAADAPAPAAVREPLTAARAALRAALDGDEQPLDEILAHGSRRPLLRDGRATSEVVVDDPAWLPAWVAAADLVRLFEEHPERVRGCANPECVLWFYDTSKNGRRRWCSMEGCGNRAKAARFQERHRH